MTLRESSPEHQDRYRLWWNDYLKKQPTHIQELYQLDQDMNTKHFARPDHTGARNEVDTNG